MDIHSLRGVEKRRVVRDLKTGRAVLHGLGDMPAILVPRSNAWYVYSGRHLSAAGVEDTNQPGAVPVEYTLAGRPQFRKASTQSPRPEPSPSVPPPTSKRSPSDVPDPRLVAVPLPELDRQATKSIRAFQTLEEAVNATRLGKDAEGRVDHIVGGQLNHPVYYMVTAVPSPTASQGTGEAWIRQA